MRRTLNKFLIVRFSSLGDVILATPLVRALRAAFPSARIDFLVKAEYTDVLKFNHHLSSIIQLKTSERDELRLLRERIRQERYDVILDLHNSLRSRFVRWFVGAKHIGVINKRLVRRFMLVHFKKNFYRQAVPVAERYLETARKFGVEDDGDGLEVFVPADVTSTVAAMMERYRLARYDTIVGLAPTARHFTKRWLPERFVELGTKIVKAHRVKLFVFGGLGEADDCGDIAQMINANFGSSVAESLAGKVSILETAAAFDTCDLIVSNDSGLLHLAAARKRKVVAIFGSTVREFGFIPYGTENIVVENEELSCRPCSHVGREKCPKGHFKCMKGISADEALAAAEQLLSYQPELVAR